MIEEYRANMEALERHPEMSMHEQRTRLTILERSQNYFEQEDWRRYQAMSKRFKEQIKALIPGMGS